MSSDIAVKVADLCKNYHIYNNPRDRLKQFFWRDRKKFYHDFKALQDVSLEVKRGETFGIVGRNGSGKSTLLQIICGTLTPTSGNVEVNGRVAALLELGAGFNSEFTGKENVYINASILGLKYGEIKERYEDIVAFADIGEYIDQPVKTYSSGMYMRLAFAVVAHVDADILVIDEALSVGDAFFTQKCMRFLRNFQKNGSLLFVSHDTAAVTNLCNRAIWLDHGVIKGHGKAKEVCESYLEAIFEVRQGASKDKKVDSSNGGKERPKTELKDQRLDLINNSPYRNDIKLFDFNPDQKSFGLRGINIMDVHLLNDKGEPLGMIVGGETVTLYIKAKAEKQINGVIIGFYIKDRLGQFLFGDNTHLSTGDNPVVVNAGQVLGAKFKFSMPILPVGDYSTCVAIAEGSMSEHVQHHWIHDALLFRSQTSSVQSGLVGIPMHDITIEVE